MILEYLSYSRLDTFIQCPKKYRYQYHDKIKLNLPEPEYFKFGHFFHEMFEHYVNGESLDVSYKKARSKYGRFSNNYEKIIPSLIKNFLDKEKMLQKLDIVRQKTELEFYIPIFDSNIYLKGFIDRIIYLKNGAFILDYKTGKSEGSKKQLTMYIWALSNIEKINIPDIQAGLMQLRTGKISMHGDAQEKQINEYMKQCSDIGTKIIAMNPDDAQAVPGKFCFFCDYKSICPKFQSKS